MQSEILRILAVAIYFCYNVYVFVFESKVFLLPNRRMGLIVIFATVNTVALFIAQYLGSPYYITYLVGLITLTVEIMIYGKTLFLKAYVGSVLVMFSIISLQTLSVSVLSIVLNKQLVDMMIQEDLFSINIICTFCLAFIEFKLCEKLVKAKGVRGIANDKEQSISIALIGTFMIIYSAFDSATMSISGGYSNLVNTIIAVQIMSTTMFGFLFFHAVRISSLNSYKRNAEILERTFEEKIQSEERLKRLIFKDNLTGCYSKIYVMEYLDGLIESRDKFFSLIYIDIDNLKYVNDNFGHSEGDAYILRASRCISMSIRENDIFARLGGDEFLVVIENSTVESSEIVFKRAEELLLKKKEEKNIPYDMSLCYGIIHVDTNSTLTKQQIIEMADKKMYEQKLQHKA